MALFASRLPAGIGTAFFLFQSVCGIVTDQAGIDHENENDRTQSHDQHDAENTRNTVIITGQPTENSRREITEMIPDFVLAKTVRQSFLTGQNQRDTRQSWRHSCRHDSLNDLRSGHS